MSTDERFGNAQRPPSRLLQPVREFGFSKRRDQKLNQQDKFHEILEVFDNPSPSRDYTIEHHCPEFTSVCPKTGQPDYGTIVFTYVPDQLCVELKSLKMYLQQFRNEGIFYEAVTNKIMDDFLTVVKPRMATVESQWTPRGGLQSNIIVNYPEAS